MSSLLIRRVPLVLTFEMTDSDPLGGIKDGAILVDDGRIVWVGADADAPSADEITEGEGLIAMPALVDCHTHMVWAGSRAEEFRARLGGANYSDILEAGGGINRTVEATRAATEDRLAALCADRMRVALSHGVGTVEVKSGYGLSPQAELRALRAAHRAAKGVGIGLMCTFLGGHTVPKNYAGRRANYVAEVIEEQLPLVAEWADFIDVYVDRGAFSLEEGVAILKAGQRHGLGLKAHAEQVSYTGMAAAAARLGAVSVEHLERLDQAGVEALARSGTVAVLLPGAMLYLRDPSPPVAALRAAGVRMAVASDLNPGTSPVSNLWTCATLACLTMGLTVEEALRGITVEAALALNRDDIGVIRPGARADLLLVRPPPGEPLLPGSLIQHLNGPTVERVFLGGRRVNHLGSMEVGGPRG